MFHPHHHFFIHPTVLCPPLPLYACPPPLLTTAIPLLFLLLRQLPCLGFDDDESISKPALLSNCHLTGSGVRMLCRNMTCYGSTQYDGDGDTRVFNCTVVTNPLIQRCALCPRVWWPDASTGLLNAHGAVWLSCAMVSSMECGACFVFCVGLFRVLLCGVRRVDTNCVDGPRCRW